MVRRALLLISLCAFASGPAIAEIARVKATSGPATIKRGATQIAAKVGQTLLAGDWLETGKNGRVAVTFVDNTRFAVGPNSRIEVSKFDYDRTRQQGSFVTRVNRGSLAVVSGKIAKSGKDAMKVQTPNSLLGVRGTRFIVEVPK
jgi:hypothetical protein